MPRKKGFKHSKNTKDKIGLANTKYGKIKVKCIICGKEKEVHHYRLKKTKNFICKGKCRSIWLSKLWGGEKNPSWKGGRYKTVQGYILVNSPEHPNKTKEGYISEHRLVMEKQIGRYLKSEEIVHHINEIKDDNDINNLMLFKNNSEHVKFHTKIKQFGMTRPVLRQIRERWGGE